MSPLEPTLLNVKLLELGAGLDGAKLSQCLLRDCMPQYITLPEASSVRVAQNESVVNTCKCCFSDSRSLCC